MRSILQRLNRLESRNRGTRLLIVPDNASEIERQDAIEAYLRENDLPEQTTVIAITEAEARL